MRQKIKTGIQGFLKQYGLQLIKIPHTERYDQGSYTNYSGGSLKERRFYNVGAGGFYHPYWTNIDYASDHYAVYQNHAFINHNLMALQDLPVPDASAEAVYTSHTIEHVSDEAVRKLLAESYRILKTGGIIRLTAPDSSLDWRAYHAGDAEFWYWRHEFLFNSPNSTMQAMRNASLEQLLLLHLFSQLSPLSKDISATYKYSDDEMKQILTTMEMTQAYTHFAEQCRFNSDYPSNHINWWTVEKTKSFLQEAGFSCIYSSAYGQSACPPMRNTRLFDNTMPKISFYIEAVKT